MTSLEHSSPEQRPRDLREYIQVVRSRRWTVLLVTLGVVAAALAFSILQTPIYEGRAQVLVRPFTSTATTGQAPQQPDLVTEQNLVSTPVVADRAKKALGTGLSVTTLLKHVRVEIVSTSQILSISYADPHPQFAAAAANAFANGYIQYRRDQFLGQVRAAAADLNKRIATVQKDLVSLERQIRSTRSPAKLASLNSQRDSLVARLGVLEAQLNNVQGTAVAQQGGGELVERAATPTSPASPNLIKNGILAVVIGLALGLGLAFLRERLDDRLRGRSDLEERAGAPVLAVIPKVETWREREEPKLVTIAEPKGAAAEAYRTLRTSVMFAASQDGLKSLMVTSPGPGEGKTTTAANLAVVLAQADKRVILISADLRKPRIHRFFGLSNRRGLVNVLAGELGAAEALQTPDVERLRLLGAGPSSGRPAEWLQSERMGQLLGTLRDHTDFLIIDAAPVLVVADPLALAPMVDGILFVADAEDTSRHGVERAREHLDQVGARIIGCVLNDFDPSKARVYEPYAYRRYHYGRRYRYAEDGYGAGYETGNGQVEQRPAPTPVPPAPPVPGEGP
jgi:non-specific protein-tyrosine kinase